MAYNEKTGNYITPVARASFPKLDKPAPIGKNVKPDAPEFYQITLLFDKEAQETDDFKDLKRAFKKAAKDKWGDDMPRKVKSPFLTIDDLRNKVPAGYTEEHVFIRLKSEVQPQCMAMKDGKRIALTPEQFKKEVYAGCDVKASVNVYAWKHDDGGAGVSFGLANVLKVGDNDPFGAVQADAQDDFGAPEGGAAGDFDDDDMLD